MTFIPALLKLTSLCTSHVSETNYCAALTLNSASVGQELNMLLAT